MKKVFTTACSVILLSTVFASSSALAYEQDVRPFVVEASTQKGIETQIASELNTFAKENGLSVSFDNVKYTINTDVIQSEEQLKQEVKDGIEQIKQELLTLNTKIESKSSDIRPSGIEDNGDYYIASVENMIPAIGWGYVNQDFKASVSGGKINSISLEGDSYKTGVTLSGWTHNRSWDNISTNKKYAQIHMKGVVSYIFKGSNIETSATFLATTKVGSNNRLVSATYSEYPN
ncbi:MAG: hypothetical protein ACQEXV_25310 [Bacillota bacterium]